MKPALFHPKVRDILRGFPEEVRREIGKLIFDLQKGTSLTMPLSKPMPSVEPGVEELRVKDRAGIFRVFYFARRADVVLIFHAFQKKTKKTSQKDIETGQKRLQEMLNEKD
ncbi:MAG: type II toxin-antitoxin system RelE/ParE family toxin [Nitrospirae bacterium]|nr:type II toxin-antitoxin system RelE/ParE family toxin [Nitrospirota bacterium]MBI3351268.1 type II toxin-antitoxin system RelE/ParE family toxin [Nitrospirota bacterium]